MACRRRRLHPRRLLRKNRRDRRPRGELELFGKTRLTKAIRAWIADGGFLTDHLPGGADSHVRTAKDAELACAAIDQARAALARAPGFDTEHDLHAAIALLQHVETDEARQTFIRLGLSRLRSLINERVEVPAKTGLPALFALKILGHYRQPEDANLFVAVARAGLESDSYSWVIAFYPVTADNPCSGEIIAGLANPLPVGFIRVAYLDCCNQLAIAGRLPEHPFGSAEGLAQLETWLTSNDADTASYAVSACAALPFIPLAAQSRLLELASKHSAVDVRLESAWASAKAGMTTGAQRLVEIASDVRYSRRAVAYLEELGLDGQIPPEILAPEFVAKAEMCQWISHPNEFGRPPDHVELIDTRELFWPPTRDRRRLWLVRYAFSGSDDEDKEGYGLVGSVTWAMFGSNTTEMRVEDIYGLHCAWELQSNEDAEAPAEMDADAGRRILLKYNPRFGSPLPGSVDGPLDS